MSHEIETMAYSNEKPWHGLGVELPPTASVDDMLEKAGLDWTIHKQPIITSLNGVNDIGIKDYHALVRDSDNKVLDVVGNQYRPVQNREAFKFFNEFVTAGKAKMETAGSLRGGKYIWGLANLNQSFELEGKDKVKGYLLVASPHERGKSLIIKLTTIRVVCNNTLTLAIRNGGTEFRMAHRVEFDDNMRERAKEVLGIARDQMGEFESNARLLKKRKMNQKEVISVLANIYSPHVTLKELNEDFDKKSSPSLKRVMDVLHKAPGAEPDNAWGVLNAVTYYSDHVASRTIDKRLVNAWLGKTANHKQMALTDLLKLSA